MYLFLFGCAESSLLRVGLLWLQRWGLRSSCGARAPHRGVSSCGAGALRTRASVAAAHGLSCMWDLPRSGIEPVFPVLQGRFLTAGPPGKPHKVLLHTSSYHCGVFPSYTDELNWKQLCSPLFSIFLSLLGSVSPPCGLTDVIVIWLFQAQDTSREITRLELFSSNILDQSLSVFLGFSFFRCIL